MEAAPVDCEVGETASKILTFTGVAIWYASVINLDMDFFSSSRESNAVPNGMRVHSPVSEVSHNGGNFTRSSQPGIGNSRDTTNGLAGADEQSFRQNQPRESTMKPSTLLLALLAFTTATVSAAILRPVLNFGANPGNKEMWIYVPDQLAPNPAVIVALHGCLESALKYYLQVEDLPPASDKHGFIVIYPGSQDDFHCWDVATEASLTHNQGSDSLSIVNMVKYTIAKYNADPSKVFATGSSSGAMMSQILAAAYPDVFSAVSAYSGLPYGCLRGSPGSSPFTSDPACSKGEVIKTGAEWDAEVKSAWPGYNGSYPAVQVWHGTADQVLSPQDLEEEIKQWTTVFGVQLTEKRDNDPLAGYTRSIYGDGTQFEAYLAEGVGHVVPTQVQETLRWFGLV
ncbi:Alpha/Beta hydrolase protein [Aspergillus cavernicola]|uniref:Carboxylic ester hydrolase n=1 Tax=Aspergillus cavernicola TaxID=176166 RepID=A0ABR4I683_9EURO